eukprot:6409415-Prorocentrum_lima.AAC.1
MGQGLTVPHLQPSRALESPMVRSNRPCTASSSAKFSWSRLLRLGSRDGDVYKPRGTEGHDP